MNIFFVTKMHKENTEIHRESIKEQRGLNY